jgi:hypothetical protein
LVEDFLQEALDCLPSLESQLLGDGALGQSRGLGEGGQRGDTSG